MLGKDPDTGEEVMLRSGRFGPYVQRGETARRAQAGQPAQGLGRPAWTSKRRWRCWRCRATSASIRRAARRSSAGIGRYGPFVLHDGTYANLESVDEVFSVGLNRAVSLIAGKEAGARPQRGRGAEGAR